MATPHLTPVRVAFPPFELNSSTGELQKGGLRVRLAAQPLAILLVLLQRPGEIVRREELRDQIWGVGTFVDFEHGLNAAMNKLRRALRDSAENPRYIETVPGRGYRFIGALDSRPTASTSLAPESASAEEHPQQRRTIARWERLVWAAAALVCLAFAVRIHSSPAAAPPNWTLNRITSDAGLSAFPALSPDGSLVAYSSDGGQNGERDLYVRQVAGVQPIRLTFDGSGNTAPDFSPDSAKIVFRSNRNGGGIFEVPALGGDARLLARGGLGPKYSPDGSLVAYWAGTPGIAAAVPGSGAVWVVSTAGGSPRRIGPSFSSASQPIWLPDGKRLLFVGYTSTKAYQNSAIDWWVAGTDGSSAVKTGLYDALVRSGLRPEFSTTTPALRPPVIPSPGCWSAAANTVVFSLATGEQADLWEIELSLSTGKVNGAPRRLTASTVRELYPSCRQDGTVAFTGVETTTDVWSLDLSRGLPPSKSAFERITTGPSSREFASITNDGRFLAFASNQSGRSNIWIRDLRNGNELPVASSSLEQHYPVSSPSGEKIAFSVFEKDSRAVYTSSPGGPSEKLCDGCLRATDWSRDERTVLVFGGNPYEIDALDVASRRRTPIVKHQSYNLLHGRFSPDNQWVSFTVRTQPGQAHIVIAPLTGSTPVPESAWITITESTAGDWANWSPDGRTLYFSSARDGHNCFWGQRIEAFSHRPMGEPFPVLHLHGRVYSQPATMWGGWSVGGGRIAMVLAEDTGNIWTMSRSGSR